MFRSTIFLFLLTLVSVIVYAADIPVSLADEVAQRMTALSVKQGIAANDRRVAQTRKLLDQVMKRSQGELIAIETTCSRYVGHLYDAARIDATPLELLEALAAFGKTNISLNDTLQAYVAARKTVPTKSHAEAMMVLGRKIR